MPITKVRLLQRVGLFFVQPVCYAKKNVYLCIAFSVEGVIGRDVGIGRQDGLKIRWAVMPVWVQVPLAVQRRAQVALLFLKNVLCLCYIKFVSQLYLRWLDGFHCSSGGTFRAAHMLVGRYVLCRSVYRSTRSLRAVVCRCQYGLVWS